MSRDESELIHIVYSVQTLKTTKGDWFETIQNIKEVCIIQKSDAEIKTIKKNSFKEYIKKKIGFEYLQRLASKHSNKK